MCGRENVHTNHLHTAYHLVQMRGVSTTLLHRAAVYTFTECGWSPLLHYSNGTIYVASSATQPLEPGVDEIQDQMAEGIEKAMPREMAQLIVGSPLQSMMPKVDLFDYQDLKGCLTVAAASRQSDNISQQTRICTTKNRSRLPQTQG